MRIHKFRAWHKDNKIMVYFDPDKIDQYVSAYFYALIHGEDNSGVVEQCIGWQDKKDVDIYAGDILKHPNGELFIVKWDDAFCGFRAFYKHDSVSSSILLQIKERGLAVVVGNIHENPELLKEMR